MNLVIMAGRLSRHPELRALPSGRLHCTASVVTTSIVDGEIVEESHAIVAWDHLATVMAQYLSDRSVVMLSGALKTRMWEDDRKMKHYRTEVVVDDIETTGMYGKDMRVAIAQGEA